MTAALDTVEALKLKLSSVLKHKVLKDNEGLRLRNMECLYTEELSSVNFEIEFNTDQIKQLKNQIYELNHQKSLVTICAKSEQCKIDTHINDVNNHKTTFDDLFMKVQRQSDLRQKEIQQHEQDGKAIKKQKQKEIDDKNDQMLKETLAIEKECENIECECTVLKKRNNAIMLKLRRKLIETENLRKELKRKVSTQS